jgi:hypothetical protein
MLGGLATWGGDDGVKVLRRKQKTVAGYLIMIIIHLMHAVGKTGTYRG